MKILVTDDSKIARKMLINTLSQTIQGDYEIFEGQNGQDAVDIYKQNRPDIVFTDLTMPIMDGFEALKNIKQFDSQAKVVVVSADIQKQAVDRAIELGAFDFIKKPIDLDKMQEIFKRLVP